MSTAVGFAMMNLPFSKSGLVTTPLNGAMIFSNDCISVSCWTFALGDADLRFGLMVRLLRDRRVRLRLELVELLLA